MKYTLLACCDYQNETNTNYGWIVFRHYKGVDYEVKDGFNTAQDAFKWIDKNYTFIKEGHSYNYYIKIK